MSYSPFVGQIGRRVKTMGDVRLYGKNLSQMDF